MSAQLPDSMLRAQPAEHQAFKKSPPSHVAPVPAVQVVALQLLSERLSASTLAADQAPLRDQVVAAAPSLLALLSSPDAAVRSAAVGVASAFAESPLLATSRGTKSKAAATGDAVRAVFAAVERMADRIAADPGAVVFLLRRAFEEAAGTAEPGAGAGAEAGDEAEAGSGTDMDEEDRCAEALRSVQRLILASPLHSHCTHDEIPCCTR